MAADYTLEGAKWGSAAPGTPSGAVTYSFATQDLGGQPFHFTSGLDATYQADVQTALAAWSAVANVGFVQVADSAASDIRIGWEHLDGPYSTLAQTYWTYQDGQMLHTWIGFDDSEQYAAIGSGHLLGSGIAFSAIAEHEIGHAIGLDHYTAAPAIMNALTSVNQLQTSDIDGAQALYGAPLVASAAPPPAAPVAPVTIATTELQFVFPPDPPVFAPALGAAPGNETASLDLAFAAHLHDFLEGEHPDRPTPAPGELVAGMDEFVGIAPDFAQHLHAHGHLGDWLV